MIQATKRTTRSDALDLVATTLLGHSSRLTRLLMGRGPRTISRTEAGLLTTLSEGPRRITELAETEALAQPSVSKLVDRLEQEGLVERQRAAHDGRVVLVAMTAAGRAGLEAARSQVRSLFHQTLRELDDDELASLVAAAGVLERLIETLQKQGARS
jgi:DNA-binding MarR family transcriptional regulator